MSKNVFMFLDDDVFHPDGIRKPRVYYDLIGAPNNVVNKYWESERVFFTCAEAAIEYMEQNGCPNFISFDNDLKRELEGYDVAKWITERDMDFPGFIPENFEFYVHSQNPIAKQRIIGLLEPYLNHIREQSSSLKM